MSLTAYIRYDSQGRIVPGGPIVTKTKPAVGNWQVVTQGTSATLVGQLRAFVKLDRYNKPLAGSLFLGKSKPATGKWLEVNATYSSNATPTYYLYAGNFCSSGDLTFVRSTVALSINDVIYLNDGNCCTIASVHEGPNYDVDYVSSATCFVAPCPTTTTTTTAGIQSFDAYVQSIYLYPNGDINLFAGSDVVTTIYLPAGQVFGAPGTIAYANSSLTVPISDNPNATLYVQRVGDNTIYTFTSIFTGASQQIPHFSGNSKNIPGALAYLNTDGLVTRIINGPDAGAINLTTSLVVPYIGINDTLQVGTQLYTNDSLTTPLNPGLTYYMLPMSLTQTQGQRTGNGARAYEVNGDTGIISAVLELAPTYMFNQWNDTKVKDALDPCDTFYANGVVTSPEVTSLAPGVTVLGSWNGSTRSWDSLSWPYLTYDNIVYSLSNGTIVLQQPC